MLYCPVVPVLQVNEIVVLQMLAVTIRLLPPGWLEYLIHPEDLWWGVGMGPAEQIFLFASFQLHLAVVCF
jgi:hypothetical protein